MDNNTKVAFPSIFDTAVEADKEFDNVFGGEEDSDLMDAVCGFKEDGTVLPDDAELHQTDDDATPKDLADELGEDHDTKNAPKCGESDAPVLNKKEGNNISCPNAGVEDSVAGDATKKVDPEDIEGEADKATEKFDEAYNALMREAAEDLGEEVPAAEETPAVETPDATEGEESDDDDAGEDLVSDFDDETEESGTVDNSNTAGDPPDEENPDNVSENALLEVSFSFLPKLKQDKKYAKLKDALESADELLSNNGIDSKVGCQKAAALALRIVNLLYEVESILTLPACLTIVAIPAHLVVRAFAYAAKYGEEYAIKEEAKKLIAKLNELKNNTTDKKTIDKIDAEIDKVNEKLKAVKKTVKEDADLVSELDADEEDLINKVEGETSESEPSADELEKELNTDTDEDLIDIVSGSAE